MMVERLLKTVGLSTSVVGVVVVDELKMMKMLFERCSLTCIDSDEQVP
jgi:predicted nuclease of predicted toxin-antitoxin system